MNKASGGDGILVELFQILEDDGVKVLHSICQQIWKTQQWPQGWKRSVFIPIPKKDNAKECSNYCTIALISHTNKVMLKILQASFNSTWTEKFQMFKLVLEKAEEPEVKLPTSTGSWKKQESSRKTSISALLTMLKPSLKDFQHYFACMWNEHSCTVVWTFFGIVFLWDWNENWPFPALWPLLSFPNLLAYWVQHFHSIIFQDLE